MPVLPMGAVKRKTDRTPCLCGKEGDRLNGKRWAALILMMAFFSLSGCGGREVSEEAVLKNGDRVTRELTDTVTLDAEVRLPENWDGTAEVCTVKQVNNRIYLRASFCKKGCINY